ncbi:MAG: response regulator transcription factor [Pseudomonadota bacterium]
MMRILVADDHSLFRDGVEGLLQRLSDDVEVSKAASVAESQDALRAQAFDLIILDLFLPDAEGMSGLKHLRSLAPSVPIVVVSASEMSMDISDAINAGASGYIPKSTPTDAFISALKDVVEAGDIYVPRGTVLMGNANTGADMTSLSPRRREVLSLVIKGKTNREIAEDLGISEGTTKLHVNAILKSLGFKNRVDIIQSYSKQAR